MSNNKIMCYFPKCYKLLKYTLSNLFKAKTYRGEISIDSILSQIWGHLVKITIQLDFQICSSTRVVPLILLQGKNNCKR